MKPALMNQYQSLTATENSHLTMTIFIDIGYTNFWKIRKIATTFGDTVEEDQARRTQDLSGFFEVHSSGETERGANDGNF